MAALDKIYFSDEEARKELGAKGHRHVRQNYSFDNFEKQWVDTMLEVYEQHGSWSTNKYSNIVFKEVA